MVEEDPVTHRDIRRGAVKIACHVIHRILLYYKLISLTRRASLARSLRGGLNHRIMAGKF